MDIDFLMGISTIFVMIAFAGICWWAFAPKRKKQFDEAANLPFADDKKHRDSTSSLDKHKDTTET
jgi:cytochrome c oxidase cbb3-type subunit 4